MFLALLIVQKIKMHVHSFGGSLKISLLNITSDVELSVCGFIDSCVCPISSNVFYMMIPYFELRYRATILASAADGITFWMMVETTCTATFFFIGWPSFDFFINKKCPPD